MNGGQLLLILLIVNQPYDNCADVKIKAINCRWLSLVQVQIILKWRDIGERVQYPMIGKDLSERVQLILTWSDLGERVKLILKWRDLDERVQLFLK